jgi:dGTPase
VASTGTVAMVEPLAEALAEFRTCNYERIYLRPASVAQGHAVGEVLRALVEHLADRPNLIPGVASGGGLAAGSADALAAAVTYVGGMTDRYAFQSAVAHLGWDPARLPGGSRALA